MGDQFVYGAQVENGHLHGPSPVNTRIMIAAVVVLFVVVVFILLLHMYARWFWRTRAGLRSRRRGGWSRRRTRFHFVQEAEVTPVNGTVHKGLDKSLLETLPIFYYTDKEVEASLDCAVCLSEFVENESGRRLPRCNHIFHTECIDMWLGSHSTCPLCRASVTAPVDGEKGDHDPGEQAGEELLREAAMVGLHERGEGNSIAIQILQEEGGSLLAETGIHEQEEIPGTQDHVVVNMSLNSPRNGGCGGAPPSPRSNSVQSQSHNNQSQQFPATSNVLFWGNQTLAHMSEAEDKAPSPRTSLVIEVPRRSFGNFSATSGCSSQLASPVGDGQRSPGLGAHLRNLKRLLSPRKCSDCSEQPESFRSACHTPVQVDSGRQTPV